MTTNLIEQDASLEALDALESYSNDTIQDVRNPLRLNDPKPRRSQLVRNAIGVALLAAAFGGGWWVARTQTHREGRMALPEHNQVKIGDRAVVTVAPVVARSVQRVVEAVGTLHAFEEITLSSKQDGRVQKVFHDMASVVRGGDVLLELDPTDARLAVEQSERSVQAELAKWGFARVPNDNEDLSKLPTVVSARLKFELAESRLKRMIPLHATRSVSEDDFEQSRSDARVFESDWNKELLMAKSAAATARLRQADLAVALQRLEDTQIRVPTPTRVSKPSDEYYTVSERLVSEGTLVRPGTEVFRLVLGKTLKLRLSVPEVFSSAVAVGQSVEVSTSGSSEPAIGTVARISPAIDRATRSFTVEVEVPNDDNKLRPGSFAKARILISVDDEAVTIPLSGLYSFAGIHKIFVVKQDVAHEIKVTLGEQSNDWVEISSPSIEAGTIVATSGQRLLSEGIPVMVRNVDNERQSDNQATD